MKTSSVVGGLTAVAVAVFGSIARGQEGVPSSADPPVTDPPSQAAAASPRPDAGSPSPSKAALPSVASTPPATHPPSEAAATSPRPDAGSPPPSKAVAASAPSAPPCAPPEPPRCTEADSEQVGPMSTGCSGMFGIRGSVTRLSGVNARRDSGLMLWAEGEEYVRRWIWSTRSTYKFGIGGGGAGFEGTLFGGWAGGVRIPAGKHHGPVLRAGLVGYLRGNDAFYGSLLELPQLQLGYQYLRGSTVIELGATSGAVLVGRSRTGEAVRRVLGAGMEIGAYGALQLPWVRLGLNLTRLPTDDGLSAPVDVAEGTLCARLAPLALCADARATFTEAVVSPDAPASEVRSVYAGLSLGFTRER
jgi:hypothetical protein